MNRDSLGCFPVCVQVPEYITDQNADDIKDKSVGFSTVAHSGCGPVAIYNAEVLLGKHPNFDDILKYFDTSNTLLFGYAGVLPDKVISYFTDQGYKVIYNDDIASFSAISATLTPVLCGICIIQILSQVLEAIIFNMTVLAQSILHVMSIQEDTA